MKQKNLLLLISITLLIVVLAVVAGRMRDAEVVLNDAGQNLFPGLFGQINNVSSVEIRKAGQSLVLRKDNERWVVKEKNNYPANLSRIKSTLIGVADFTAVEAKTSKAELYEKLGVNDAGAATVTLKDGSDKTLASVLLGNRRPGSKPQQYVRKAGEEQSWLVNGYVAADPQIDAWLDKLIVDIKRAQVQSVTINHKKVLRLQRGQATDPDFKLADPPARKKIKAQASVNVLAAALENLNFEDVVPAASIELPAAKAVTADTKTFDGILVHTSVAEKDGKWYLRLTADYQAPTAPAAPGAAPPAQPTAENNAESTPPAPATPPRSPQEVMAEVDALKSRTADWVYVIAKNKAENLTKELDELLE